MSQPIKNYLRPREVEECQQNLKACDMQQKMLDAGFGQGTTLTYGEIEETRRAVSKRLEQAPPDLTPEQRTTLKKRVDELEEKIKVGMLSHEEMRRCPPEAIAQNVRWLKANKRNIHIWKNAQVALMKGASQLDVSTACNVARLRPRASQLNMDNAIVGSGKSYSFPSESYKQGWDNIDWHRPSAAEPVDVMDATDESEE